MQFILEKIELWLLIWCVDLGQLHKYKDQSPSLDIPWTLLLCETFDKTCHHIDHICSILRDEKMQILKLRLSLCYVMCHYFLLLICEIMMLVRVFDPTWSTEECRYDTKQMCLENRCKKINIWFQNFVPILALLPGMILGAAFSSSSVSSVLSSTASSMSILSDLVPVLVAALAASSSCTVSPDEVWEPDWSLIGGRESSGAVLVMKIF